MSSSLEPWLFNKLLVSDFLKNVSDSPAELSQEKIK